MRMLSFAGILQSCCRSHVLALQPESRLSLRHKELAAAIPEADGRSPVRLTCSLVGRRVTSQTARESVQTSLRFGRRG